MISRILKTYQGLIENIKNNPEIPISVAFPPETLGVLGAEAEWLRQHAGIINKGIEAADVTKRLNALKSMKIREMNARKVADLGEQELRLIQFLEGRFSKEPGGQICLQVFGLTPELAERLKTQYSFFQVKDTLFDVKRLS